MKPVLALALATAAMAQQHVWFRTGDGGTIVADLYGRGTRGVVLAHGGQFKKESWAEQARTLADAGFTALAIDFRGVGGSHGPEDADLLAAPLYLDVLGAVHYLKQHGAKTVSVVGGSLGGSAAGDASVMGAAGEIDAVVMLGAAPNLPAERLKSRALFLVARDDATEGGPRLPGIRAQYEKAPQPKELIVVEGSAHAQFLFETDQRERVTREILRFVSPPLRSGF